MPRKILLVALAAVSALAFAEDAGESIYTRGDPAAGEALYGKTCLSCHGPAGASKIPAQPILAAQHPAYTFSQLQAYKSGERQNAVMLGMSANLTEQDMTDLAVYLGGQEPVLAGAVDETLVEQGRLLYRGGVPETGAPACLGCHGPAGKGIPPDYPRVGGQYAEYLTTTLLDYQSGARVHDVMNTIASRLSEDQIKALSEYISGLH